MNKMFFNEKELLSSQNLEQTQGGAVTKRVIYRQCGAAYVRVAKEQTISFTNENGVPMTLKVNADNTFTVTTPTEVLNMQMGK
jgi:hypothetical protein